MSLLLGSRAAGSLAPILAGVRSSVNLPSLLLGALRRYASDALQQLTSPPQQSDQSGRNAEHPPSSSPDDCLKLLALVGYCA